MEGLVVSAMLSISLSLSLVGYEEKLSEMRFADNKKDVDQNFLRRSSMMAATVYTVPSEILSADVRSSSTASTEDLASTAPVLLKTVSAVNYGESNGADAAVTWLPT